MKKSSWLLVAVLALTGSSSWGMWTPSWWPFRKTQSSAAVEAAAVVASGQFKYQNANKDWVTLNPGDKVPTGVALVAVSAQASLSEADVTVRAGGGDVIQVDPSGTNAMKVTVVNSVSGNITVATKGGAVATLPSGAAVVASNGATPFTVVSGVVAVTVNGQTTNYSAGQTVSTAPQQVAAAAAPETPTTIATTSPTQEVTAQPVSPSHP